jgi:putative membrane protein
VLFARENVARIADLVVAALPGLVLAACCHVLPMTANARAWQRLFEPAARPRVRLLVRAVWLRESVNGILPVARIGGEIAAYRFLRSHVADRAVAAATLIVDMALSVMSQAAFTLIGLAVLVAGGHGGVDVARAAAAIAFMAVLGVAFMLAQRSGAIGLLAARVDRVLAGKVASLHARSVRVDEALRAAYDRKRDVASALAWQLGGWVAGAGEIWLALHFIGHPASVQDALVIEAIVQAASSAAFIVPGALGIQEGAFLLVGAALGLDATTSLALAAARRLRDVVVFVPGVAVYQWSELRHAKIGAAQRPSPQRSSRARSEEADTRGD